METGLRKYIVPNMLAMAGTSCYVLADTFFISLAEGAGGIAALNLVLPLYGLIYGIGSMIGVGSATQYSLRKSLAESDADPYFFNALAFAVLCGSVLTLCGVFCPEKILTVLGADAQLLSIGTSYTRIVLCFAPFFMLNYPVTAFLRNDGAPRLAMWATLLSGGFNILFDYLFMFPLGMGMAGAALATGLSPVVSICVCMVHYASKQNTVRLVRCVPSLRRLAAACRLGVAALVGELSGGVTTLVFNFILLDLAGNTAVAAYGVIANLALVGISLLNGIALGLQPVASLAHGQRNGEQLKQIRRSSLCIGLAVGGVLLLAAAFFANPLVRIFNSEGSASLAGYAQIGLRLYFLGFPLAAVNIVKAGFYGAVGKGAASSAIALSRGIFSIAVMAFLLSRFLGVTGVWLAFPASEGITWLGSVLMEARGRRKAPGPVSPS